MLASGHVLPLRGHTRFMSALGVVVSSSSRDRSGSVLRKLLPSVDWLLRTVRYCCCSFFAINLLARVFFGPLGPEIPQPRPGSSHYTSIPSMGARVLKEAFNPLELTPMPSALRATLGLSARGRAEQSRRNMDAPK